MGCSSDENKDEYQPKNHLNSEELVLHLAKEPETISSTGSSDIHDEIYHGFDGEVGELYVPLTIEMNSIKINTQKLKMGFPLELSVLSNTYVAETQNDQFNEAAFDIYLIKNDQKSFLLDNRINQYFYSNKSHVNNVMEWPSQLEETFKVVIDSKQDGKSIDTGAYRILLLPTQVVFHAQEIIHKNNALVAADIGLKSIDELPLIELIENVDSFDIVLESQVIHIDDNDGQSSATIVIPNDGEEASAAATDLSFAIGTRSYGKVDSDLETYLRGEVLINGVWSQISFLDLELETEDQNTLSEICNDLSDSYSECHESTLDEIRISDTTIGVHPHFSDEQLHKLSDMAVSSEIGNLKTLTIDFRFMLFDINGVEINDSIIENNVSTISVDTIISTPAKENITKDEKSNQYKTVQNKQSNLLENTNIEDAVKFIDDMYTWEYTKNLRHFRQDFKIKSRKFLNRRWHFDANIDAKSEAKLGFTTYPLSQALLDSAQDGKIKTIDNGHNEQVPLVKKTWAELSARVKSEVGVLGKKYTPFDANLSLSGSIENGMSINVTIKENKDILFSYIASKYEPQNAQLTLPKISINNPISPLEISAKTFGFSNSNKPNENKAYRREKSKSDWEYNFKNGVPKYEIPSKSLVLPKASNIDLNLYKYKLEKSLVNEAMTLGILPLVFRARTIAEINLFDDGMKFIVTPPDLSKAKSFNPQLTVNLTKGNLLRTKAIGYVDFGMDWKVKVGPSWLRARLHAWAKTNAKLTLIDKSLKVEEAIFNSDINKADFYTKLKSNLTILHGKATLNAGIDAKVDYDFWIDSGTKRVYHTELNKTVFDRYVLKDQKTYKLKRTVF